LEGNSWRKELVKHCAVRQQWQLSLREVEERSLRFAQERGSQSYQISASWLARLEREDHELTVGKLIALADIYNIPAEQLLRSIYAGTLQPIPRRLSSPNVPTLLTEGPLEERDQLPDETSLLAPNDVLLHPPYRRGIIGKRDHTLEPMIPPGSIVHIDTQKRAISLQKDWTHEFQRPVYFLMTRDAYVCDWCELDKTSDWLTLIPHPLSRASSRRWRYHTEIENLGSVIAVAIRFGRVN